MFIGILKRGMYSNCAALKKSKEVKALIIEILRNKIYCLFRIQKNFKLIREITPGQIAPGLK